MSRLHKHLIPKRKNFQVRIIEPHDGKPKHVTYGIWIGIFLILMLPSRKGTNRQVKPEDVTKGYSMLLRSMGLM